jgi:adenylosuccinate synthase
MKMSMNSGEVYRLYKSIQKGKVKALQKPAIQEVPRGYRPNCVCVEDAFFGDSGKGAVVAKFNNLLNKKKNLVSIRFNGGANAGHESKLNGKLVVTHQLPMGVTAEGATAIISRGMVIHPEDLITEIASVQESLEGELPGKLIIDERVTLALDTHRAFESALNSFTTGGRGATGKGISPGYASHYERISITLKDLLADDWEEKLKAHYHLYGSWISGFGSNHELAAAQVPVFSRNKGEKREVGLETVFIERLRNTRDKINAYASSEIPAILEKVWKNEKIPVTIEGAQGAGLDPYHGVYPDITASRPISRFLNDATYNIILPEQIFHRAAVMKTTYMSSVGIRKLPAKKDEEYEKWIQESFDERGRTTGRLRDIYPISIPIASYLRKAAGYNFIVATHLDASTEDRGVKVVIGYENQKTGKDKPYLPYQDYLNTLKPKIVEFEGWDGPQVSQAKSINALPKEAKKYLAFLSAAIAPVSMCTFGPGLDEYLSWN